MRMLLIVSCVSYVRYEGTIAHHSQHFHCASFHLFLSAANVVVFCWYNQ